MLITTRQMLNSALGTLFKSLNRLPPSQNVSKSESKNFDVFGSKFVPNTFTFVDQFLLVFWDEGSKILQKKNMKMCEVNALRIEIFNLLNKLFP
jgi:hypothetical protein